MFGCVPEPLQAAMRIRLVNATGLGEDREIRARALLV